MDLGKLHALVDEIRERARIGETVGQEAGSSVAGCVVSGAGIAWEDAAKRLAAVLDNIEAADRWVSVGDRLPEAFDNVWIVTLGGWVGRATFLPWSPRHPACFQAHTPRRTEYDVDQITHWKPSPLPAPPKEGA